jgi:hypothetical protein
MLGIHHIILENGVQCIWAGSTTTLAARQGFEEDDFSSHMAYEVDWL